MKKKLKEYNAPLTAEDVQHFDRLEAIFRCGGYDFVNDEVVEMKDAMDIPNAAFLIPRVLTTFVQEGIEPLCVLANLLQRIEYVPGMQTVFPAIDVLTAREVGDGMSLPIFNINTGGGQTFGVTVKRHGLQLRVNQKFVQNSTFPWISWWMKLAGQALIRHKEEYVANFINMLGTVMFDNDPNSRKPVADPAFTGVQPKLGITTGRNIKGQFNGSMVVDDVFSMYCETLTQGFTPNTLLMHPMHYLAWVRDPVMREFAIQAGGGQWFGRWTGNAAAQANPFFNFNGLGFGRGQNFSATNGTKTSGTTVQELPQGQQTAPQLPGYAGLNFQIIVSPFVRFDPVNRVSDITMFDRNNLGALIVDEDPHVTSWTDPQFSINNIGVEETYGFGIINEGQAVTVARNISVKPNEFVLPARAITDISGAGSVFEEIGGVANFHAAPVNPLSR